MDNQSEGFVVREISPAELVDFFMNTGVKSECPSCGNENAAIQADSAGTVRFAFTEFVELGKASPSKVLDLIHPSVMTICDRCGYIRNFSAHKIFAWLQARDSNGNK